MKTLRLLLLAAAPLCAHAQYQTLPPPDVFAADTQTYLDACFSKLVDYAFWGSKADPADKQFLLENETKIQEKMLATYRLTLQKSAYEQDQLARGVTKLALINDLNPKNPFGGPKKTCNQSGWTQIGRSAAQALLQERDAAQRTSAEQVKVQTQDTKMKENPVGAIDYAQHLAGIGSEKTLPLPAAGTTRSIRYASFKQWSDATVAKFNAVALNSEPYAAHRLCKNTITSEWKTSFGYAHSTLKFTFADGTWESYTRESVVNGACLTSVLTMAGVSVNNE